MIIKKCILILILLQVGGFFSVLAQDQKDIYWDKELIRKIVINDKKVVNKLLFDLFIIESDVSFIEIYDVDKNGPAEGDLLKVYPSEMVYPIKMLSAEVQEIMNKWPYSRNIEKRGKLNYVPDVTSENVPPGEKILSILAYAVRALYSVDKPLKLFFDLNESGVYTYEVLGFKEENWKDKNIALGNEQEKKIMDFLKAFYEDVKESEGPPTVIHVIKEDKVTIKVPEKRLND